MVWMWCVWCVMYVCGRAVVVWHMCDVYGVYVWYGMCYDVWCDVYCMCGMGVLVWCVFCVMCLLRVVWWVVTGIICVCGAVW